METPSPALSARIRWIRALDILQYSLIALGLLLVIPSYAQSLFRPMTPWYLLAGIPLGRAVLLLPPGKQDDKLSEGMWRLRASAILMIGFAPFIYWYRSVAGNHYLLLGAFSALLCFFWHLGEYAALLQRAAAKAEDARLERRAQLLRQSVLYLGAVPLISLHGAFLFWPLIMPRYSFSLVATLWFHTPLIFAVIMSLPPILLCLYIALFRHRALQWDARVWQHIGPED